MFAVALLADPLASARLTRALALGQRTCYHVEGWSEVEPAVRCGRAELLVFDPYIFGRFPAEELAACVAALPSITLFAYGRFPPDSAPEVLRMAWAGVHGAAVRDLGDSPTALAQSIDDALQRGFVGRAREVIESGVAASAREMVMRVLSRAGGELTPADVARLCHCHPKTVATHLRAAGLPSPGKMIVWMRLAHAARLLAEGTRSIESVALDLGFPSSNSFRNQLSRYTGTTPTQLRAQRDPLLVVRLFARTFQQCPKP